LEKLKLKKILVTLLAPVPLEEQALSLERHFLIVKIVKNGMLEIYQ